MEKTINFLSIFIQKFLEISRIFSKKNVNISLGIGKKKKYYEVRKLLKLALVNDKAIVFHNYLILKFQIIGQKNNATRYR